MRFRKATLLLDGKTLELQPNRSNTFEEIYADFQQTEAQEGGTRYSIFLHPKQDVTVQGLDIQFDMSLPEGTKIFANGYQSWSESRLLDLNDRIPRLWPIARSRIGLMGDNHIKGIPRGRGKLHSWTYTYFSEPGQPHIRFLGSLNERTGFTLFLYDRSSGVLTVRKDMDQLALSHSFPALDFWMGQGPEAALFERYFQLAEIMPPGAPPAFGWTSWYQHFNRISAELVLQNLESFAETCSELSDKNTSAPPCFQIDDGWQTMVGDWLGSKPEFPNGMLDIALKIRQKNLSPGLWLAPFIATPGSALVRRHPEWLLKDAKNKPLKAGWNPLWGGWFYALDFYQDGVREYLSGVFHTLLDKWGFEWLKLDFLYAAALAPPPGKTRGAVMWEAMEFLRRLCGTRRMLACGVPLGACFGLADYCRIGGDVHLRWQNPMLSLLRHRERVDTLASLRSTLSRWQLNGRAFHNDPDVFILRTENQGLSPDQQQTLLTINALLGNVCFTSDDTGTYSELQKAELEEGLDLRGAAVQSVVEVTQEVWKIEFKQADSKWVAWCNLTKNVKNVAPANGAQVNLRPYETLVLKS